MRNSILTIFKHSMSFVTAPDAGISFDEFGTHITGMRLITD